MSSIAKANISLSKKDLTKSRILPVASRNSVFYHKASLGDQTIDLLALSMPSEINLSQITNEEISDARLYNNRKNLRLVSSSKGELIQGLDYLITSGYTINLIGPGFVSGAEADEIFVGTINASPVSDLTVASAKTVVKKYVLAIGETTLNLGREYKLSEDGVLKVFVNGVLAQKDADYEEVDAGNGYGSVIEFYVAPVSLPHQILVDFGVVAITDNNAIGDIESLSGSVKKLADDLAVVAGTSAEDYLNANPSEVERRWFGDTLLKILSAEVPIREEAQTFNPSVLNMTVGNGTLTGKFTRKGSFADIEISFTSGTTSTYTSGQWVFEFSEIGSIDLSKVTAATRQAIGFAVGQFNDGNQGQARTGVVVVESSSGVIVRISPNQANYSNIVWNSVSTGVANNFQSTFFSIKFTVPIAGWSATKKIKDIIGV